MLPLKLRLFFWLMKASGRKSRIQFSSTARKQPEVFLPSHMHVLYHFSSQVIFTLKNDEQVGQAEHKQLLSVEKTNVGCRKRSFNDAAI